MNRKYHLVAIALLFFVGPCWASGPYAEIGYTEADLSVDGSDIKPEILRLKFGWQFTRSFALEAHLGSGITEGEVGSITADVKSLSALLLRYGSPVSSDFNLYFVAGASSIDMSYSGSSSLGDENYGDFAWGIGIEERLQSLHNLLITFEYMNYYDYQELDITAYNLGFKYAF